MKMDLLVEKVGEERVGRMANTLVGGRRRRTTVTMVTSAKRRTMLASMMTILVWSTIIVEGGVEAAATCSYLPDKSQLTCR